MGVHSHITSERRSSKLCLALDDRAIDRSSLDEVAYILPDFERYRKPLTPDHGPASAFLRDQKRDGSRSRWGYEKCAREYRQRPTG